MAQKPNVIIFGGLNELASNLALHLVPLSGEPLVSHLRIVDKYAIDPPATYVVPDFPKLLRERKDLVEYRQADLTVPAVVATSFADPAPNAQPYTHIIDLSGEVSFDRDAQVFISDTLNVSLSIAHEAARNSVKSYVRYMPSFYENFEDKAYAETDVDGWKPFGTCGVWWHETARAIGSIPNLPLVLVRGALPYGPGYVHPGMTTAIVVTLVYKQTNQDVKFVWRDLRKNTIHSLDWVGGIWATSLWAGEHNRADLDSAAGASLPPSGDRLVETTEGTIKKAEGGVLVPVINLVDESDMTIGSIGVVLTKIFDIKVNFQDLEEQIAQTNVVNVAEKINSVNVDEWNKILANSNPPISSTPLSPAWQPHRLLRQGRALDGKRLKNVVGYTLKYPAFNEDTVRETIEAWRAEGIWPNVPM